MRRRSALASRAPSRSAAASKIAPTATTQLSAAARTTETTTAEQKKAPVSSETARAAVSRQVPGETGPASTPATGRSPRAAGQVTAMGRWARKGA